MINLPPQFLQMIAQQVQSGGMPGKGGGSVVPVGGLPQTGGMPGKGGGAIAGPIKPPMPPQSQVPQFASPMTGTPPGQMPNIREAMMQNMTGMLGQPNFGVQQMAPRGLGNIRPPVAPSAPPAMVRPPRAGGSIFARG